MRWIPVLCYLAVKAGQVFAQGVTDDDEPPPFIPKTNLDFGGSIISTEPSLQGTVVVVTTSAGTPVTLSVSGSAFVPTYTETAGPDTPAALQSTSTLAPSTSTLAPSTSSQTPSAGTVLDVDATPSSARPVDLVSSAASDDAPPFISKTNSDFGGSIITTVSSLQGTLVTDTAVRPSVPTTAEAASSSTQASSSAVSTPTTTSAAMSSTEASSSTVSAPTAGTSVAPSSSTTSSTSGAAAPTASSTTSSTTVKPTVGTISQEPGATGSAPGPSVPDETSTSAPVVLPPSSAFPRPPPVVTGEHPSVKPSPVLSKSTFSRTTLQGLIRTSVIYTTQVTTFVDVHTTNSGGEAQCVTVTSVTSVVYPVSTWFGPWGPQPSVQPTEAPSASASAYPCSTTRAVVSTLTVDKMEVVPIETSAIVSARTIKGYVTQTITSTVERTEYYTHDVYIKKTTAQPLSSTLVVGGVKYTTETLAGSTVKSVVTEEARPGYSMVLTATSILEQEYLTTITTRPLSTTTMSHSGRYLNSTDPTTVVIYEPCWIVTTATSTKTELSEYTTFVPPQTTVINTAITSIDPVVVTRPLYPATEIIWVGCEKQCVDYLTTSVATLVHVERKTTEVVSLGDLVEYGTVSLSTKYSTFSGITTSLVTIGTTVEAAVCGGVADQRPTAESQLQPTAVIPSTVSPPPVEAAGTVVSPSVGVQYSTASNAGTTLSSASLTIMASSNAGTTLALTSLTTKTSSEGAIEGVPSTFVSGTQLSQGGETPLFIPSSGVPTTAYSTRAHSTAPRYVNSTAITGFTTSSAVTTALHPPFVNHTSQSPALINISISTYIPSEGSASSSFGIKAPLFHLNVQTITALLTAFLVIVSL
ncbi:FAFR473Wp [Eremothecium gossypii FDAG1]|nr:FAFR473Wp [Eremothecium gossypii FDAG1]